jgi:hypothetical protein
LGIPDGVLQPGAGQREGWRGRRSGYFRRNHLVPVPKVKDLCALNEYLRTCCQQDEQRRIHGKPLSVGEAMGIEREHLLPLLREGFELAETSFPVVDGQGCVKVRTNRYSVPLRPRTKTQARLPMRPAPGSRSDALALPHCDAAPD